jgi:hypothetical protein
MRTLIILLSLFVSGCMTSYQYKHDGQELTIKSYREFPEGIKVVWDGKGFIVESGSVVNDSSEVMASALLQAISLIQPIKGG